MKEILNSIKNFLHILITSPVRNNYYMIVYHITSIPFINFLNKKQSCSLILHKKKL